jgi:hypothetical protein
MKLLILYVVLVCLYFIPSIVALTRKCKASAGGIIVLNLLLGWTLIGWIVALVWAASARTLDDEKRKTEELARAITANSPSPYSLKRP